MSQSFLSSGFSVLVQPADSPATHRLTERVWLKGLQKAVGTLSSQDRNPTHDPLGGPGSEPHFPHPCLTELLGPQVEKATQLPQQQADRTSGKGDHQTATKALCPWGGQAALLRMSGLNPVPSRRLSTPGPGCCAQLTAGNSCAHGAIDTARSSYLPFQTCFCSVCSREPHTHI